MINDHKRQFSEGSIITLDFWLIVLSITFLRLPIALGYRTDLNYLYLGIIPYLWGYPCQLCFSKAAQANSCGEEKLFFIGQFIFIHLVGRFPAFSF